MSRSTHTRALDHAVDALQAHGVVPAIAAPLRQGAEAISRDLLKRVIDEVDAFSSSANPEVLPELQQHLEALVAEVWRLLSNAGPADLAFVRRYAQRRAQQRFPLEASLHMYRCSHRVISGWIRDVALAVADSSAQVRRVVAATADFAIEYTDAISTVATSEYVLHTRLLAEAEGNRRTELLNTLLSGYDESDSRTAQLLRRSGYLAQRQSFCVAVARSVDPREMENTARAQRMVVSIGQVLRDTPVRSLIGIRDGLVTLVVSGTRRLSGWTAPQSLVADRVFPRLDQVGPAALIGLSTDAPSTSHIPRALNEARLALDFASVANRVMPYARIPFRQMIIRHARDNIQSALPAWLKDLQRADRRARGSLSKTLHAYANANMNTLQTAKDLSVHPNTIYARMHRIADITGKNALGYNDLTELLLAIESDAGQQNVSAH
jgi:PucR-like helix-turn-helix protein/diguanylate cyclase with GGDEF domain